MKTHSCFERKPRSHFYFGLLSLLTAVFFVLSGCAAFGHRRVPADRFNYNEALAESSREQMLMNIIRLRYLEEPVFLAVSSILTQYVYNAGVEAGGIIDLGGNLDTGSTASVGANLNYEERPTITYLPVEGREFSAHLLSAIPAELIFAAAQEGWDVDILMEIGVQRIGAVENMSFGAIPSPGDIEIKTQFQRDLDTLKRFQHVMRLLISLSEVEAFEVRIVEINGIKERHLEFSEKIPEEFQPMLKELRQLLGLSNGNTFRFTDHLTGIKEDEISIQTRSVLAMMSFLSRGVEVPLEHLNEGRVIDYRFLKSEEGSKKNLIPFRVFWSKQRPDKPFAAVKYQDYWFYIANNDINSKRTLGLIIALFRLQAPSTGGVAPILTLPTG
ncbi:MAG: hypothetical protein PVF42_04500 [Desulfobacterales bacterium]|jgi:hypothetical protein